MDSNTIPATVVATAYALLRLPEVQRRCSLSRSEIYRRCAADPPTFPRPVKLGEHASAWAEHEVSQWIADRIAARDAKARAA
jgi:prophage regulatory protein